MSNNMMGILSTLIYFIISTYFTNEQTPLTEEETERKKVIFEMLYTIK